MRKVSRVSNHVSSYVSGFESEAHKLVLRRSKSRYFGIAYWFGRLYDIHIPTSLAIGLLALGFVII